MVVLWLLPQAVKAATNIDSTYRYAWNDVIGWIDFYVTDNVFINPAQIQGYANSSVGYIALNCNSTPNGDICGAPSGVWRVYNDGNGNLTGWAWNDAIGWISFTCDHTSDGTSPPNNVNTCSTSNYQVTVSGVNGVFTGWAWNNIVGWVSFNKNNCDTDNNGFIDTGYCGGDNSTMVAYNYKVKTSWRATAATGELVSAIFDTQILKVAAPNAILWQGIKPTDTSVKFQIASSNCSNGAVNPPACDSDVGWTNKFIGLLGTSDSYYEPIGPNEPVSINLAHHNNKRYIRYKAVLVSNPTQTASPKVDDIIINWSP